MAIDAFQLNILIETMKEVINNKAESDLVVAEFPTIDLTFLPLSGMTGLKLSIMEAPPVNFNSLNFSI